MMTALDGHAMARAGRGAQALATAAIGSFIAGTIATVGLTFVAPLMVELALKLGAPEYFALMVLSVVTVSAVLGDSTLQLRGRIALKGQPEVRLENRLSTSVNAPLAAAFSIAAPMARS